METTALVGDATLALPPEIWGLVLEHLPVQDLVKAKYVCKLWCSLAGPLCETVVWFFGRPAKPQKVSSAEEARGVSFDAGRLPVKIPPTNGFKHVVQAVASHHQVLLLTGEGKVFTLELFKDKHVVVCPLPGLLSHFVVKMASGENHTMFITDKGEVLLLDGYPSREIMPAKDVPGRVIAGAVGVHHFLIVTDEGKLFSRFIADIAVTNVGQTGLPTRSATFLQVPGLDHEKIVACAAGGFHSLALTATGKIYAFGWGEHGSLGVGDREQRNHPVLVERMGSHMVIQVTAGRHHSICLTGKSFFTFLSFAKHFNIYFMLSSIESGRVFTWGIGQNGARGTGLNGVHRKAVNPEEVTGLNGHRIVQVCAGEYYVLARSDKGQVFAWGENQHCQLGTQHCQHQMEPMLVEALTDYPATFVAAGGQQSVVITHHRNQ
ncbi:putative E3 ubiquitin-protein ligase herc1 [Balamuthia mandrillaris]